MEKIIKYLLSAIFLLNMGLANAQSDITGAFGVELGKPFDINQPGVIKKEDEMLKLNDRKF